MTYLFGNLFSFFLLFVIIFFVQSKEKNSKSNFWSKINLPKEHMPYYFFSNEKLRNRCFNDEKCPFKLEAAENATKCWGYEANCSPTKRVFEPKCPGDSGGWVQNLNNIISLHLIFFFYLFFFQI